MGGMPNPGRTYRPSDPDVASTGEDGNIKFYNQVTGKVESRPIEDLQDNVGFERHTRDPSQPDRYKGHGDVQWQLRTGGGLTAEMSNQRLQRLDQGREAQAKQEQLNREARAEADRRAAEAEAARQAAIRQQKIDNLNKRIEFEKTNVLKSTVRSATGKAFDVYSPGQKYVVPEGADILEGRFERLPNISLAEYRKQQGETGSGRLLGRGGRKRSGVTDEEEGLGTGTLLSEETKTTSLIG